jgi:homoserine O-succinyltransferase/O-acetyltransferase
MSIAHVEEQVFKRHQTPAQRRALTIALVNSMPDSAFLPTERQFRELLAEAAFDTRLRLFSLPEVVRVGDAAKHMRDQYEDFEDLFRGGIDAVIVTGTEPRTPDLRQEPYWGSMTRLIDWCGSQRISGVWSCLAAHVAVLHLDGIERRPLPDKLSGIYACHKMAPHVLTEGLPDGWHVPHSRWNNLFADDLSRAGYQILTGSPEVSVNLFAKEAGGLFVFLQGHPEYHEGSLPAEYTRDIGRYLRGERATYPTIPANCFDATLTASFLAFRAQALEQRNPALLAELPVRPRPTDRVSPWRPGATRLYQNWLSHVLAARSDVGDHLAI